jgi:hypothetical protein
MNLTLSFKRLVFVLTICPLFLITTNGQQSRSQEERKPIVTKSKIGGVQSLANYTFEATSDGSLISTSTANGGVGAIGPSQVNVTSAVFPIGFDFFFMGNNGPERYDAFTIGTQGCIKLGLAAALSGTGTCAFDFPGQVPVLAPFTEFMRTSSTGVVAYRLVGNEPERFLVVDWTNMTGSDSGGADMRYQLRLYEGTGVIEFVYGNMVQTIVPRLHTVFLASGTTAGEIGEVLISPTGDPQPSFVATGAVGTGTNGLQYFNAPVGNIVSLHSTDASQRRVFRFIPRDVAAPTNLVLSDATATSITATWDDNASTELGYAIYLSVSYTHLTLPTKA